MRASGGSGGVGWDVRKSQGIWGFRWDIRIYHGIWGNPRGFLVRFVVYLVLLVASLIVRFI